VILNVLWLVLSGLWMAIASIDEARTLDAAEAVTVSDRR
jgi:uncharacterized membrane protein YccF (DUF307 family)